MSYSYIRVQGRDEPLPVYDEDDDASQGSDEEREKREYWDERLVLGGGWLYKQDVKMQSLGKERDAVQRYVRVVDDVLFGGRRDGQMGWERERERISRKEREGRHKGRRVSAGDIDGRSFRFPSPAARQKRRVVSTGMLDAIASMSLTEEPEEMVCMSSRRLNDVCGTYGKPCALKSIVAWSQCQFSGCRQL